MTATKLYTQTQAQSAELLRLVLARMGQHRAAFNPVTFAVWYEHLAGINPRLSAALEERRKADPTLGDDSVQALHRGHIAEIDEPAADRITGDFRRVMQSFSEAAQRTGDFASSYGQHLTALNEALDGADAAPGSLAGPLGAALAATARMQAAVADLQAEMQTSRSEIEKLRADLQRTREESLLCPLTRVLNRKGFDLRLQQGLERARNSGEPLCLVMIDIDHFKPINDTHGHLIGDRVLEALGAILRMAVRAPNAAAARYGGEEFALLLSQVGAVQGAELAEAVRENVKKIRVRQRSTDRIILGITVSAGVAASTEDDDASSLVARADAAMYAAKRAGRDRVVQA
jgi:diguanylate cyclase